MAAAAAVLSRGTAGGGLGRRDGVRSIASLTSGGWEEGLGLTDPYGDQNKNWSLSFGLSTLCSFGLLIAGIILLGTSFVESRETALRSYDEGVHRWIEEVRPALNISRFYLSAKLPAVGDREALVMQTPLEPIDSDDWYFRDSEGGRGVDGYLPLKFQARLALPCFYANCSAGFPEVWTKSQVPPVRSEAPQGSFEIRATGRGSKISTLATPKIPILWGSVATAQSPQPRMKCQSSHGLMVPPRSCYHAQRLAKLCMAIEMDSTGAWQLHSHDNVNGTHHTGGFGCDRKTGFESAGFRPDPCWGPFPNKYLCEKEGKAHTLEVTVRASQDPYFSAAQLTRSSFDFGASRGTRMGEGLACLALGGLVALLPLANCMYTNRQTSSKEEREGLSPGPSCVGCKD
eukprot:TRINITY_DN20182_c0_g1_i1.p1 TRINITY_DN20182_c0_g1~~TRINITY_DN20182_c0_g1_i1.p1  ORF type:complete len:416 (-),score=44.78 TRINITY_DN20182_c0_g1_i1:130-1332(-)